MFFFVCFLLLDFPGAFYVKENSLSAVCVANIRQSVVYLFVCRRNIFLRLDLSILSFVASGFSVTSERSSLCLDE